MKKTSDPIERQAAIDALMCLVKQHECDLMPDLLHWTGVKAMLESLPSAQRTGRWKVSDLPKGKMKYCSECGFGQYIQDERIYSYCPNCGAQMEEQE